MVYSLLALTVPQIIVVAVCAAVGLALIIVAIVGIARSSKRHAEAGQLPLAGKAAASEKNPEAPADANAEAPVTAEETAEEFPAPKAKEAPEAEEPAEETPAPEAEPAAEETAEEAPAPEAEPAAEETAEEVPAPEAKPAAEEAAEEVSAPEAKEVPAAEEKPAETVPVSEDASAAAVSAAPATDKPSAGTTRVVYANDDGWYVNIRYDKSFEAKLIQGDEKLKTYYSELKNELLSYKKVTARKSWQHEAFRRGRTTVAKLAIRGKTLRLYLALEPMLYEDSKYRVEDASQHAKFAKTPLLYRIKNDRRCRYAKDLIAAAMASAEALRGEDQAENYADVPFEDTEALIAKGLVRIIEVRRRADGAGGIVMPADDADLEEEEDAAFEEAEAEEDEPEKESVAIAPRPPVALTVQEVQEEHRVSVAAAEELMADEEAEELVSEAERVSDRRRQTIVNIDTLSEYFADGERVGIEEMKQRIPFFNKKATYVKVLARGVLTKTLEVEADDFSLDAVKMIALLGGKVYKSKK